MKINFKVIIFCICLLPCSVSWGQWGAHDVRVNAKPASKFIEDYATEKYQDGWDFNEGDLEGIARMRRVNNPIVSGGKLTFQTSKGTALIWGGIGLKKRPTEDEESICHNWRKNGYPWYVRVKLSQSLKHSEWYVKTYEYTHGRTRVNRKKAILKGSGDGELLFPMSYCKNIVNTIEIGTNTPGNKVEIDFIKLERFSLERQFKKKLVISGVVKTAKFVLGSNSSFRVFVNGKLVHENGGVPPIQRKIHYFEVDSSYWLEGKNELLIETEVYGSFSQAGKPSDFFFMEGVIHQKGQLPIKIVSDKSWLGRYKFSDEKWKTIKDVGPIQKSKRVIRVFGKHIEALYKPYLGSIDVSPINYKYPFFLKQENVKLDVKLLGSTKQLKYTLFSSKGLLEQGKITVGSGTSKTLDFGQLNEDDYILKITNVLKGKIVDERVYEFLVLGKIEQTEIEGKNFYEGLDVKLVDEFDPVRDKKVRSFIEGSGVLAKKGLRAYLPWRNSKVSELKGKKFLQTGAIKGAWFSFKYKIKNIYKPHVIEIEYPSNRTNSMVVVAAESADGNNLANIGPTGGVPRAISGFYQDSDGLEKFQTYKFIFWPNDNNGTVSIVNTGHSNKDRASVSHIKIYEIENELPAVKNTQLSTNILYGPFSERIDRTIPRVFYTGKLKANFSYNLYDQYFTGYYSEWRRTFSNLIKYLRFTGSNSYFAGVYMYHAAWFSSEHFQGRAELGLNNAASGWDVGVVDLMARMFEANDLNLVLGVQFFGSKSLLENDNTTQKEIYQGKDTIRFVTKNGKKARGEGGFNFLHPSVRQEMLLLADDISKQYSAYPSIKGIIWMRSPEFIIAKNDKLSKTGLDTGYDDLSIRKFEKDTGIKVNVAENNPQRFNNRFRWLMKNERENWINWRTTKTYELMSDISTVFNKYRADWNLWYLSTWPTPEIMQLVRDKKIMFKDIFRYQGHDPDKYSSNSHLKFIPIVDVTSARNWKDKRNNENASQLINFFIHNEKLSPFLDNGFFLRIGFMIERNIKNFSGSWPWKKMRVVGNPAPKNWVFDFAKSPLSTQRNGMKIYPFGWSDGGHMVGHEQAIRDLKKALQSVAK